jgi:hypothetical protein
MIHRSPEDAIANEYFSHANGTAAILLLSLGYTSLQFRHPEPFAWFTIIMSMVWLFSIGGPYRKILRFYLPQSALTRHISIIWHLKVFIISLGFVLAVALGLRVDDIYSLLGYPNF